MCVCVCVCGGGGGGEERLAGPVELGLTCSCSGIKHGGSSDPRDVSPRILLICLTIAAVRLCVWYVCAHMCMSVDGVTGTVGGRVYLAVCYAAADVSCCQLLTGRELCVTHRTGGYSGRRVGGAGLAG